MEDYEKQIKSFFEEKVASCSVPPMKLPEVQKTRKKRIGENLFLAACILGSLILIARPAIYDNKLRKSYVPMSKYEAFKEEFPRVIFRGSLYFKQKQGVKND